MSSAIDWKKHFLCSWTTVVTRSQAAHQLRRVVAFVLMTTRSTRCFSMSITSTTHCIHCRTCLINDINASKVRRCYCIVYILSLYLNISAGITGQSYCVRVHDSVTEISRHFKLLMSRYAFIKNASLLTPVAQLVHAVKGIAGNCSCVQLASSQNFASMPMTSKASWASIMPLRSFAHFSSLYAMRWTRMCELLFFIAPVHTAHTRYSLAISQLY